MKKEFYNISKDDVSTKVLVSKSIQYCPYTRELTISRNSAKKLRKLGGNLENWYIDLPTPYCPKALFDTN